MSFDEQFRSRLHSEVAADPLIVDSRTALGELRPAMRRARRARTVVSVTAVSMLILLVGLLVATTRNGGDAGERLDPASSVEFREPNRTDASSVDEPSAAPADDDRSADDRSDSDAQDDDVASDDEADVAGASAVAVGSVTVVEGRRIDGGQPQPDEPVSDETDEPDSTASGTASGDIESDDTHSEPSTSTSTPSPEAASAVPPAPGATSSGDVAERFESACGDVIADRSSGSVSIIEILPDPGYRAVAEDPDHGSVTVQFTGVGEDCELRIPATGTEPVGPDS